MTQVMEKEVKIMRVLLLCILVKIKLKLLSISSKNTYRASPQDKYWFTNAYRISWSIRKINTSARTLINPVELSTHYYITMERSLNSWKRNELSRVLVTLDAGLARWVDLSDIHKAELQLVVTQSYSNYEQWWHSKGYCNYKAWTKDFSSEFWLLLPGELSLILRPTVSRSVYLEIKHLSGAYDQIFITIGFPETAQHVTVY
jgi:hypothetical protein